MQHKSMGTKGLVCIMINCMIASLFIGQARLFAGWVGNASWILLLLGFLIQLIIFLVTAKLYESYYHNDPLDLADELFGGVGKVVVGTLFMIYYLFSFSSFFRLFSEAIKTVLFPNSPIWYISLFLILCVGFGAHAGILSLARVASILLPIIVLVVFLVCAFNISSADIYQIYPMLGKGSKDIFTHLADASGFFSDITILYFFLPFSDKKEIPKKMGVTVLVISGIILFCVNLIYTLSVTYPASTEYFVSMYQLARISHFGIQLGRLADITEFFWIVSIVLSLAAKLWLTTYIFKKMLNLSETKPIVWPFAILGLGIGFFPSARNLAIKNYETIFVSFQWMIVLVPLFLVFCFGIKKLIRRKKTC